MDYKDEIESLELEMELQTQFIQTLEELERKMKNYDSKIYNINRVNNKFLLFNDKGRIIEYTDKNSREICDFSIELKPDLKSFQEEIKRVKENHFSNIVSISEELVCWKQKEFMYDIKERIVRVAIENDNKRGYVSLYATNEFEVLNNEVKFIEEDFNEEEFFLAKTPKSMNPEKVKDVICIYYKILWFHNKKVWLAKELILIEEH